MIRFQVRRFVEVELRHRQAGRSPIKDPVIGHTGFAPKKYRDAYLVSHGRLDVTIRAREPRVVFGSFYLTSVGFWAVYSLFDVCSTRAEAD